MGVEYNLNDPARGESFDFGKGWHGVEGTADYERAPSAGPGRCRYHAHRGPPYRWTPLASRDETLHYVTSHFYFLEAHPHSEDCAQANFGKHWTKQTCVKWCEWQEPDLEYANRFADKLWTWLQGRDQAQLDITNDCDNDDIRCRRDDPTDMRDHERWCVAGLDRGVRHFYETGSRYD